MSAIHYGVSGTNGADRIVAQPALAFSWQPAPGAALTRRDASGVAVTESRAEGSVVLFGDGFGQDLAGYPAALGFRFTEGPWMFQPSLRLSLDSWHWDASGMLDPGGATGMSRTGTVRFLADAVERSWAQPGAPGGVARISEAGHWVPDGPASFSGSGGAGADTIIGGMASDLLEGGEGDDRLLGGDGGDELAGGPGRDTVDGQRGDDRLWLNDGDDVGSGGSGNDMLDGENGNDVLYGFLGDDRLLGGEGNDVLRGGEGRDTLEGQLGADFLEGGAGSDLASGGSGDDTLDGGAGDDVLHGLHGDDVLRGGMGHDVLLPGSGVNSVWGGEGADRVVFDASALVPPWDSAGLPGVSNILMDFRSAEGDRVDLRGLGLTRNQVSLEEEAEIRTSYLLVEQPSGQRAVVATLAGVPVADLGQDWLLI